MRKNETSRHTAVAEQLCSADDLVMSPCEPVDLDFMRRHLPAIYGDGISQEDVESWLHSAGEDAIRAMAFAESVAPSTTRPARYDAVRCLCSLIERGDGDHARDVAMEMLRIVSRSPQFDSGIVCV